MSIHCIAHKAHMTFYLNEKGLSFKNKQQQCQNKK